MLALPHPALDRTALVGEVDVSHVTAFRIWENEL